MRTTARREAIAPRDPDRRPIALLALVLTILSIGLWVRAGDGLPMSTVDEHMHLDTHARVHQGEYPHRGSLMSMEVVREWACGVGHEAGAAMAPCEHPDLGPQSLPSGRYTSGYVHYPTYFWVGEAYRTIEEGVADPDSWVDSYRRYAAVLTVLGLLTCLAGAWSLGLRGAALVAGTLGPSATASILLYATIANPQSAGILAGALIGWSGLRWVLAGGGFWWLAAATALASGVAVTHSLPAGVFMLAIVAVKVLRRAGWRVAGTWEPRWWQLGVLTVIVVTPVLVYGSWISRHATMANEDLYAFVRLDSWRTVVSGALEELSVIHSPWYASGSLGPQDGLLVQQLMRAAVQGLPLWMTIAVFALAGVTGGRLVASVYAGRRRRDVDTETRAETRRTLSPTAMLTACALVGLWAYPMLLRVSNGINLGFDHPIVDRYSIPFAPLLLWLVLLGARERPLVARGLAALATITSLAVGLTIW